MSFIEQLKASKGMMTYDLLRHAVYTVGLPFTEEEIDSIYEDYMETGEIPDYLEDYIDEIGTNYE